MEEKKYLIDEKKLIEQDYENKTINEVLDMLKKRPMRKYERFNFSFQRVIILEEFADLINKYSSELNNLGAKATRSMKEKVLPSQLIGEYIILEIWSFYDMIRKIRSDSNINLPDLPEYWETIRDFRNQVVAHLDKEGRFRTLKEWIEQYDKINKIGMPRIVEDFKKCYWQCYNLLKGEM